MRSKTNASNHNVSMENNILIEAPSPRFDTKSSKNSFNIFAEDSQTDQGYQEPAREWASYFTSKRKNDRRDDNSLERLRRDQAFDDRRNSYLKYYGLNSKNHEDSFISKIAIDKLIPRHTQKIMKDRVSRLTGERLSKGLPRYTAQRKRSRVRKRPKRASKTKLKVSSSRGPQKTKLPDMQSKRMTVLCRDSMPRRSSKKRSKKQLLMDTLPGAEESSSLTELEKGGVSGQRPSGRKYRNEGARFRSRLKIDKWKSHQKLTPEELNLLKRLRRGSKTLPKKLGGSILFVPGNLSSYNKKWLKETLSVRRRTMLRSEATEASLRGSTLGQNTVLGQYHPLRSSQGTRHLHYSTSIKKSQKRSKGERRAVRIQSKHRMSTTMDQGTEGSRLMKTSDKDVLADPFEIYYDQEVVKTMKMPIYKWRRVLGLFENRDVKHFDYTGERRDPEVLEVIKQKRTIGDILNFSK